MVSQKPIVAKLQTRKQMAVNIPPSCTVTKVECIPKLVNGRIELHWVLPEGGSISHSLQALPESVMLDPVATRSV